MQYSSVDSFFGGLTLENKRNFILKTSLHLFAGLDFTTKKFLWYKNPTQTKTELLFFAVFNSNNKEVFPSCRIQAQAPCK